jgi:hypothetical protein
MIGILITTFLRNDLLQKCLFYLSEYWNDDYYVIVVDQNKSSCLDSISVPNNIRGEFIKTEFDIGPLKARNLAIKRFAELNIPYILMFADNMYFLQYYDFKPVIEFLEEKEERFLCGFNRLNSVCTWETDVKKTHCFELDIPRRPKIEYKGLKFQPVDLCRNIFLCKTQMLVESLYDEDRKLADHESSFWRWIQSGYKCFYLENITFGYTKQRDGEYGKYRNRFGQEKRKMCQKYGLKSWVSYSSDLKAKWKSEQPET